jgi:hypothetical protein
VLGLTRQLHNIKGYNMTIPVNLKGRYAYHFTLLANLESIIDKGILCTNQKNRLDISHENIAVEGIQGRRRNMPVPCSGEKNVHDYVPFYFSKKTSMQLGVINKKNIDQPHIIYFAVPIDVIESVDGVVFSDASANTDIPPNFYNSTNAALLESLNWEAIDSKKWGCPSEEFRHQKMAELLIPNVVDFCNVTYLVVWNKWIKEKVENIFKSKNKPIPKIIFDAEHYYSNFYDGGKKSIVTGPKFLKLYVDETISEICKNFKSQTKFESINSAIGSISNDFSTINELRDIDGLKANYGPHSDDVGTHSRKVAAAVKKIPEYNDLFQVNKDIVLLSAYLHDIGKGPKSRWGDKGMDRADNDHAVKSLPMLKRILTEDIGNLDHELVRKIVILVTYDDLIGDIVANGRNEQQLFDIIESEEELNMIVSLGKADMSSINSMWILLNKHKIETLKLKAIEALRCKKPC